MNIIEPKNKFRITKNNKASNVFVHFNQVLAVLRTKDLPSEIIEFINLSIQEFNVLPDSGVDYRRQISKMQSRIYNKLEKELGLVPKDYYKHKWLALGMIAFGIPVGVLIGIIIGNLGYLGFGLPVGLVIGGIFGAQKDKKALKEGKQLSVKL